MSCCGQKRRQWQHTTLQQSEAVSTGTALENPVLLRFHGKHTLLVKGHQTGYLYLFAEGETGLTVDSRDVQPMLAQSQDFSLVQD